MKYKIKITTFKSGRKEFKAYKKYFLGWTGLDYKGKTGYAMKLDTRDEALRAIDLNVAGNDTEESITFEYINK